MTEGKPRSLWAAVADRYALSRELRAAPLGAKFHSTFRDGLLVLSMSNGVERRVDRDEIRAAFRQFAAAASPEIVRLVTANGPQLLAVRDDLGASGYDPGDLEAVDEGEIGEVESRLVEVAVTRSRLSAEPVENPPAAQANKPELDALRAENASLIREQARLQAALADRDERLSQANTRAEQLEVAAERTRASAPTSGAIGNQVDMSVLLHLARQELTQSDAPVELKKAIDAAATVAPTEPGLALVKCRIVLEALAKREWIRVFGTEQLPAMNNHSSLMQDLKDQPGVDTVLWNVRLTLYRVANAGAHQLETVSFRRASIVVLITAQLVAGSGDMRARGRKSDG